MAQQTARRFEQNEYLSLLSRAPVDAVKSFAEKIMPELGIIEVVRNGTGLVMLPMVDTVQATNFYLGEVLVAEAQVRLMGHEGYAACLGRDNQQALAIAIIDAACVLRVLQEAIAAFIQTQAEYLAETDEQLLRQVEATRVELETF